MRYLLFLLFIFLVNNESLGKKKLTLMEYIISASHQKILLNELEEWETEYVFLVRKIKMILIRG